MSSDLDGLDGVVLPGLLRGEDEKVRPERVVDAGGHEAGVVGRHGLRERVHQEEVGPVVAGAPPDGRNQVDRDLEHKTSIAVFTIWAKTRVLHTEGMDVI